MEGKRVTDQGMRGPRDSRLEQFSIAASSILSIERGLTTAALVKLRALAAQQRLADEQVEECLNRIGAQDTVLGRVGRYEQLFLDRLTKDLSKLPSAVLAPMLEKQVIQMAVDEFQISKVRADLLLTQVTKQLGWRRISAADAKTKLRNTIATRLNARKWKRSDLERSISELAKTFGIDATETVELIDGEIDARDRRRSYRKRWQLAATAIVICLGISCCFLWLGLPEFTASVEQLASPSASSTVPKVVDSNVVETERAAIDATDHVEGTPPEPKTLSPSQKQPDVFSFDIKKLEGVFVEQRFQKVQQWHHRLVEFANQNWETNAEENAQPSATDFRAKSEALAKLRSEVTDGRMQVRGIDDLRKLSDRLFDIDAIEADELARFCLNSQHATVRVAVERGIKQFGRWPRFLLAIADLLEKGASGPTGALQPSEASRQWPVRLALILTDQPRSDDRRVAEAVFQLARLRVRERVLNQTHRAVAESQKAESDFADHIRLFVSAELNNRRQQNYFYQLIDMRDRNLPSVKGRVELQQILVEALLFADKEMADLDVVKTYFRNVNSCAFVDQQLTITRQTMLKLAQTYVARWLNGTAARGSDLSPWITPQEARRLRDRAERAAISADPLRRSNAVEDYVLASTCGDSGIARSCLRGLMEIADSQSEKQRYRRQFDFVNGHPTGPLGNLTGDERKPKQTSNQNLEREQRRGELQAILALGRAIRRDRAVDVSAWLKVEEEGGGTSSTAVKKVRICLRVLASKLPALSNSDLDLILRIESSIKDAIEFGYPSDFQIDFPWAAQRFFPAIELTPLRPLGR